MKVPHAKWHSQKKKKTHTQKPRVHFLDHTFSSANSFCPNIRWLLWARVFNSPCSQQVPKRLSERYSEMGLHSLEFLSQVDFSIRKNWFYCCSCVCLSSPEKHFMVLRSSTLAKSPNWRLPLSSWLLLAAPHHWRPLQMLGLRESFLPRTSPSCDSQDQASRPPSSLHLFSQEAWRLGMQASHLDDLFWHHRSSWGFHLLSFPFK